MSSPHHSASNPFSKNFAESGKIDQSMGSSMGDSGVDSLILSQQGSLLGSSQPTVQMPSAAAASAAALAREDSGLSAELNRLNLSAAAKGEDAWKEYYEPDEDGDVQLHMAIASGYVEVVDALIRMCPHPEYLSIQNNASFAPLHIAVLQNQPVMARKLVVAGARLDIRDMEGNTPLHLAARRGNIECAEALLNPIEAAERPNPVFVPVVDNVIDVPNASGENCVHLAVMGGHVEFLRYLSWHSADMNAPDGRGGRSPLHFAVAAKFIHVIDCLLADPPQGCGVNPNPLDWYGRTPYQLAALNEDKDIMQCIEERATGYNFTAAPRDLEELINESESEAEGSPFVLRKRDSSFLLNSSA